MSFSLFVQQYVKPSRWWRRQKSIQITIWPRWIAQAFCPHASKQPMMWDVDKKLIASMCMDCHKHIEQTNDCIHGEVLVHVVETVGRQLLPRTFRCQHCGAELELKHLPHGVRVLHGGLNG